ncbi:hypothetical protein NZK32_10610 [Cyanobium sp. FGCU-52]|nr:hypothetical protein [Cyanobium sp. FGCU52]
MCNRERIVIGASQRFAASPVAMKFIHAVLSSTPVLALTTLLASPAHAMYLFADPTGFDSTPAVASTYNFLGAGDLSLTVVSKGDGITFDIDFLDFKTAGTSNPSWMSGGRDMFMLSFDGGPGSTNGSRELAQLQFAFDASLSTQPYLLVTDFDSYEGLAIAAFDSSSTLIPFNTFTFLRHDGEDPDGDNPAVYPGPTWSNTNPSWTGAATITGFLQDTDNILNDSAAVSLQSTTEIKRMVFYYNAKSVPGEARNSLRFNFASPFSGSSTVPGPLPVLGAGAAFGFSRKLRHRIKKAEPMKARG